MAILGYHRSHEAGVAFLSDAGIPLFAVSEERLSRIKMQGGTPTLAARYVSEHFETEGAPAVHGGLRTRDRLLREQKLILYNLTHGLLLPFHQKRWEKLLDRLLGRDRKVDEAFWPEHAKLYVDHHTCHAASAYYQSGMSEAVVLSIDGVGDTYSARFFLGRAGKLEPLAEFFHSAHPCGHNYEYVTAMLGFNPKRHCGKVTGLAAHGRHDERLVRELDAYFRWVWSRKGRPYFFMMHSVHTLQGPDEEAERAQKELLETRKTRFGAWSDADLAYAIQFILERDVTALIERHVPAEYRAWPVCLAGGVFANVKLNKVVKELGFQSVFVQPAMADSGLCIGGPLYHLAETHGLQPSKLEHVYLGPAYSDAEIETALRASGHEYRRYQPVEAKIAQLLADGWVVARFDGPMEFGPRALCNRSILYHGADPQVNTWLNQRLARTEFMPFAPVSLPEAAERSYHGIRGAEHTAEFMTITFDCTDDFKRACPAAVHIDGTARPQLVNPRHNPSMDRVLREYQKLTGLSSVINTSFNMHEEPIVMTPGDAIRSFERGHLDYLAIGPFIVENPDRDEHPIARPTRMDRL